MTDMISTFTGVGNFVTDSRTLAFIREQAIGIYANGLKPNSVVHVYFDNKNVDAFVRPAGFDPTTSNPTIDSFNPTGTVGSTLITNSIGSVAGIFYIPPGKFFTGDRQIVISDAPSVSSLSSSSTTNATTFFHAFNYPLVTSDQSIVSPRPADAPVSVTSNRGSGTSATVDTTRFDPLCQSFYIGTDMANGQDGVYLSYINVYFQAKDLNLGVSFDIRTMENGTPTTKIVPFSKTHLTSSQVNIDPNALLATQIVFSSPVFLRSGYEYALSIIPDGASSNYAVWTAVVGGIDVATNNSVVRNWGQGVLFTSSTGSTWTPIQNEYLKFDVYSAQFQSSGNATFVNADYEFLSVTNTSAFFTQGEWAYQQTANSTGTISINTTSQIVTGTGTSFQTTLTSGQYIAVTNGSVSDVLLVQSVANNTQFTSANIPDFASASASYQLAPCGKVELFDANKSELFLINSTASNSNFCFIANSIIIGAQSNANTKIVAVKDKVINRFQPQIYTSSVHGSEIVMAVSGITSNYTSIQATSYDLGSTNIVLGNEQIVASKTNEILNNSGNKSLNVNLNLSSNSSTISPIVDLQSTSLIAYKNKINKSTNKENTKSGESWSKAITQTITLAEGQDAEDIVVYINAYRPVGSDIKIYAKIQSSLDTNTFDSKDWSELDKANTTATVFSDPTNIYDYIEYSYTFKASPPSYLLSGVLTTNTTNNYITGVGTNFVTDAPVNSIIKIWSDSTKTSFQIGSVTSVTNSTALTIDNIGLFNSSVATYEFVTQPKTAFHNPSTGIVRYYGSGGSAYDSYRTFAIKTVLTSNSSYQVPRVMDIRVIAMSV